MAAQEQEVESPSSETLDQSQSSSSSTSSSSDPSLSRNVSFSKLNAQAPEFVPTRPSSHQQQQQQPPPPPPTASLNRLTVIPPPPPPPAMMHIYPPPSPFHVPIHSPVPVSHVIPVHNHHPHHHHQHSNNPNHNHHHHQHHNQQYVPVRNHNQNSSQYVPLQYHGNQNHHYVKKGQLEEEVEKKEVASSDHMSKNDRNGNDEPMQKLLNQVEYYFSDLNLATTDHLMRFINKDPDGYVPISVVASFKKVKAAINSNSHLASILRNSAKLVVSEDGKRVRRQNPLTELDVEELQSRIVVAENLPEDHCHQNLMKIFSAVGSVKTIRTCPPQTSGGGASSASRSAKGEGMHFSNKLHAFVEYESVEIAEKAVAELNDEQNWRSGLRVRLMLKRASKPTQARGKKGHDGQGHSEEEEVSTSEQPPNEKQIEDPSQQYDGHSHEHSGEDHVNEKDGAQRKGRNRGRGKGRGRGQYHHNNRGNHVGTPPSNNLIINEQPSMAKQPPGPRMPDGTKGFAMGRGKPVAVNIA
ncbi:lupus la ribonucleoprotein, putative [Ricinus communis]|uniref:Lupus la ribonucleoprotein, putative n=1 Tax=Ricinus communis TaxID=3988 RepID=B9SSZ3_RICCO|nr:lupus la ribonucleoprotein, putative [Ricinus communis]|eukprot:XP_002529112.1 la-related protein 6B [Ricinus communis]